MKEASLKKNFALNLINTISGLLFPLITFPYASRILLADGIGKVQFLQSIIDYITLFSALGIPLYAVREVAKIRDNYNLRSKVTFEILFLHTLLTLLGYIIVVVLVSVVTKIQLDASLFLLLSTTLFFNAIGVPWFYQAVEDFKYITIRTLIVRFLSLVALFIFVRSKEDLLPYAAITVIANVGSNVFNFLRLRKYIDKGIVSLNVYSLKVHLGPAFRIFMLNLIVSIYVSLDSIMLGFLKNEEAVGYYTAAIRIVKMILGVVTSFGAVLLPRFSNMIANKENTEFKHLAQKSVSLTLAITLPIMIGLIFMASPIIHLFSGHTFQPSILTLQLISPIILFIGMSSILGMYILYPQGKEKYVIISTGIGALVSFILNWLLIPSYAQYGSAIATSCAELFVIILMVILGKKYLSFLWNVKDNIHYIIGTLIMTVSLFCLKSICGKSEFLYMLTGIPIAILIYFTYLLINKDVFVYQVKNMLLNFIKKMNK